MPEPIKSLVFNGKSAYSSFLPDRQSFTVQREVVFAAARFTIHGHGEKRTHSTNIQITAGETYINSIFKDVLDKEPTTSVVYRSLSRLSPGIDYELQLKSYGFGLDSPVGEEDVSITVDLLELDSDVAKVTLDVIKKAESPPTGPDNAVNAIVFGISEASFTDLLDRNFTAPELEVGTNAYLKLRLSVQKYNAPPWPFVHINTEDELFVISGQVLLQFFRANDPATYPSPVAEAGMRVNVYCKPAMVTATEETLQIQFQRAELRDDWKYVRPLDITTNGILGGYGSLSEFEDEVNKFLDQILSSSGRLAFALPAYLESRPLPDYWHHVRNMDLQFKGFDYRTVQVHGYPISYLFVIFSVKGLDLPPPCYCESESASLTEANNTQATIESLQGQHLQFLAALQEASQKTSLSNSEEPVVTPGPPYFHVMMPAQIAAFGLSQRAFQEIARSYVNIGHDESTSTSKAGTVYASTRFWFRGTLDKAEITEDGIRAKIDFTTGGSAKAAVRDKCGNDILSTGVRLNINIDNSAIQWSLRLKENFYREPEVRRELIINALADVLPGKIHVDFDGLISPPPPLDQFAEWITEKVLSSFATALKNIASERVSVRLIHVTATNHNNYARMFFVEDEFFRGEAAVLLGHLTNYYG